MGRRPRALPQSAAPGHCPSLSAALQGEAPSCLYPGRAGLGLEEQERVLGQGAAQSQARALACLVQRQEGPWGAGELCSELVSSESDRSPRRPSPSALLPGRSVIRWPLAKRLPCLLKGPTGSVKRSLHFRTASPGQGVKSEVSERWLGLWPALALAAWVGAPQPRAPRGPQPPRGSVQRGVLLGTLGALTVPGGSPLPLPPRGSPQTQARPRGPSRPEGQVLSSVGRRGPGGPEPTACTPDPTGGSQ